MPGQGGSLLSGELCSLYPGQSGILCPLFAYNAPHFPVQPPQEWLDKVLEREPGIDKTRAKLVAFIEHMDYGIGQVVAALKKSGQYENTLIVFTSDNGGHLPNKANNGLNRDGKQSMYEGGLRVPTCVSWPNFIQPRTSSNQVNLSMDLYPTLLEVAGVNLFLGQISIHNLDCFAECKKHWILKS